MNTHSNFEGTGMNLAPGAINDAEAVAKWVEDQKNARLGDPDGDDLMSEALAEEMDEALAQPYDLPTMVESKRKLFQRAIDKERTEKARQQALVVAAQREIRHLTASIRSLEDALDSLLASEG